LFRPKHGAELWVYIGAGFAVGVALILALIFSPKRSRKPIVALVTFVAGLFYSLEFFIPGRGPKDANVLTPFIKPMGDLLMVLGGLALGLGILNLFFVHGRHVRRKDRGWHNSAAFFVAFAIMLLSAFFQYYLTPQGGTTRIKEFYEILFNGVLQPLGSTMFAVLAFFMVSAAYRAFRIKSAEATLMMAAAFVVMLGQTPIGFWFTHWLPDHGLIANVRLENLSYWILTRPNMAAQRGIDFGIGVGMLAMSLRIWLSLERGSFFDKEL
jgi:uncharacterized membrane protein YozB (DUF420 family)